VKKFLILAAMLIVSTSPAYALFSNGGFDTGDTTDWTVTGDHSVISSFTPQFNVTGAWTSGIPYYGSHSLLLGSGDIGNVTDSGHSSTASTTDTIIQADIDAGSHLFFKWGAILEEPTNGVFHSDAGQPYFSVEVSSFDGSVWTSLYYEDHRANQTGFTSIGTNASGDAGEMWYGSGIADIDLLSLGLGLNDQIKVDLYVEDCNLGGHGGLVFLDGFGTEEPPEDPVPEPATLVLLGSGLLGLAGAKFRKNRA
jgi:PEP-CTERM motif-containing protein